MIGLGLFNLIMGKKEKPKEDSKIIRMDFIDKLSFTDESKKIVICKEKNNCPHALNEENYYIIKYDYDSKNFQKNVVDKFNNNIVKMYNETIESATYPGNCLLGDIFNYYKVISVEGRYHENSKFLSFSILPSEVDYCTMKSTELKPIVFNYSKEKDKVLSISEFMDMLGIDDKVIHEALETRLKDYNNINKTEYTFEQLIDDSSKYRELYFLNNGELDVSFYNNIDKKSDVATIYGFEELLQNK